MRDYTLVHVSDAVLLRELSALVAQERGTTAKLLAHIAEVDARRLYAPAGYPSMHAYCVEELRLSEDAASRRIHAARAARRFPELFVAVTEGRLHLTAVCLLAPYLMPENAGELIEAATHRRKSEIEAWLARRFPVPGMPSSMRAISAHALAHVGIDFGHDEHAAGHVAIEAGHGELAPGQSGNDRQHNELALGPVDNSQRHAAPSSLDARVPQDERVLVPITMSTREKLRYAQALLSHAVPTGDVAQILDRALDALIAQTEKRKLGAGRTRRSAGASDERRSTPRRAESRSRYVPAHVRRAVWERDQGQCTFISASGHRCGARRFLEFDHAQPVARGGRATVEGMRLRCRTHNQYEAERTFGAAFMSRKREEARLAAAETRARVAAKANARAITEARAAAEARARAIAEERAAAAAVEEQARDVVAGLRSLGCRRDEARRAAEFTKTLHGATLEERLRAALRFLSRRSIKSYSPAEVIHAHGTEAIHTYGAEEVSNHAIPAGQLRLGVSRTPAPEMSRTASP